MADHLDRQLMAAHRSYEIADQRALHALRQALPPGRQVKWKYGDRWRMGAVVEVLGFSYGTASVRVDSINRKRYDVGAYAIREALR